MGVTKTKKEIKKSKSIGIRYNIKKYNIALSRSGEKRVQGLFDFLLDFYLTATGGVLTPHQVAQYNVPYVTQEKPPMSQLEAYEYEIKHAGSHAELEKIGRFVEKDAGLSDKDKTRLRLLGHDKAKDFEY